MTKKKRKTSRGVKAIQDVMEYSVLNKASAGMTGLGGDITRKGTVPMVGVGILKKNTPKTKSKRRKKKKR